MRGMAIILLIFFGSCKAQQPCFVITPNGNVPCSAQFIAQKKTADSLAILQHVRDSIGNANNSIYANRVIAFYKNNIVGTKDTTITTLPKLLDVVLILGRLNGMIDSSGYWRVPLGGLK